MPFHGRHRQELPPVPRFAETAQGNRPPVLLSFDDAPDRLDYRTAVPDDMDEARFGEYRLNEPDAHRASRVLIGEAALAFHSLVEAECAADAGYVFGLRFER
jgi:hypothetical protein